MSHAAKKQETEFSTETDVDLLTIISWREEDDCAARDAWAEFYRRHVKFLYAVCRNAYANSIGQPGVENLVSETFLRVFTHGAATFQPTEETDADNIRRHVRSWLRSIAHNLFLMELRSREQKPEKIFESLDYTTSKSNPISEETAARYDQIRTVIENELTDRERDVLFARLWNYDVNANKQIFDNEVLAELVDKWDTTATNIRQILSRAVRKIRDRLADDTT